ncbi:MAG: hypothetical protein ACLSHV_03445 [Hominisplanchenecus sp.]
MNNTKVIPARLYGSRMERMH